MFEIKALLFILAEILISTFALKIIFKGAAMLRELPGIRRAFLKNLRTSSAYSTYAGDIDHRRYSNVDISLARIRSAANGLLMTIIPRLHNCLLSDLLHEPFVGESNAKNSPVREQIVRAGS